MGHFPLVIQIKPAVDTGEKSNESGGRKKHALKAGESCPKGGGEKTGVTTVLLSSGRRGKRLLHERVKKNQSGRAILKVWQKKRFQENEFKSYFKKKRDECASSKTQHDEKEANYHRWGEEVARKLGKNERY